MNLLQSQNVSSKAPLWLYDLLLLGFCLGQMPRFLFEYFTTTKYKEDLGQRFGIYSPALRRQFQNLRPAAWIHAVSVGEVVAATPLIRELSARYPDFPLIISTVTRSGRQMVKKSLGPQGDQSIFLPFDFQWITERVMRLIRPRFLLLTETEIWPNLIHSAARHKAPIMLVNGRISSRSYQRYRLVRSWLRPVLDKIRVFGMQSDRDAARIISLGADPKRVFVTGNLKFDQAASRISPLEQESLAQGLRLSADAALLVAGSTHRGEEEVLIGIYRQLLSQFPNLALLIAPRYLPQAQAIEALCRQAGVYCERKSLLLQGQSLKPADSQKIGRLIILDTIGELSKMYSLATVVFVGGSLVPVGGHNLLEPATYGKPVLFGPYIDNFRQISELLKGCGAGFEVKSGQELKAKIEELLQDRAARDQAGRAAWRAVEENRGATGKTINLIERYVIKPESKLVGYE
ncbi:MAG: 3-deoxy-D-manno-octulosonic acid transferase [bacterium]|nr:3-deoxy-D-manno-octulosonic acid transferase [bacterium]